MPETAPRIYQEPNDTYSTYTNHDFVHCTYEEIKGRRYLVMHNRRPSEILRTGGIDPMWRCMRGLNGDGEGKRKVVVMNLSLIHI